MNPLGGQLGRMLLASGAYFVVGKLALLMAIPPGYATAVWPAAGIALVALLHGGYRFTPAIAPGSFLVNAPTSLDHPGLAVAASIGVGAALQAAAARFLIRRWVGYPNPLERARDVVGFLALAGPVACLVGATCGVSTLMIAGAVSRDAFAISWSTWWVGDTIGVVIFGPVLLVFVGEPRTCWRSRRATVGIPLAVGFSAVTAIFIQASAWEQQRLDTEFARRADGLTRAVEREAETYVVVGAAVAGLYQARLTVTQDELEAFALPLMARHRGLLAVSWVARIAAIDRSAYEHMTGHFIGDRGPSETLEPAAERPEYFPVHAIAPFARNRGPIGFDLGTEPRRWEALERARDSGLPAATAPIDLLQDRDRKPGLLIVVPVFRSGAAIDTTEHRRAALIGYSSTVVRAQDVVAAALQGRYDTGFRIRMFDASGSGGRLLLYDEQPADDTSDRGRIATIKVAGRTWRVEAIPTSAFINSQRSWQAWLVLAAGLAFVALLGAMLLIVTGNESRLAAGEARYRDLYDQSPDMYVSVCADTGEVLDCNQTAVLALRRERAAILGRPVFDLYTSECHEAVRAALTTFRNTGEVRGIELTLRRGDDTPLDVSLSVTAVRDPDGRIVRSRSVWRDIASRKQIERDDALRMSLADRLRSIEDVDTLLELVTGQVGEHLEVTRCFFSEVDVELDTRTVRRDFHRGVRSLVGAGPLSWYSPAARAALGAGTTLVESDAGIEPRSFEGSPSAEVPTGFRAMLGVPLMRGGRWVASLWVTDAQAREWTSREVGFLQSIAERTWLWIEHARMIGQLRELNYDLEQRVADRTKALETSVREKDVLLREIHHRVKNNLQVISSLLSLQASTSNNPDIQQTLGESRDRIQSLALVHDQLYRASNAAIIALDQYLRELILSIERTHGASPRIRIVIETSACSLPLDQAVPCGLIVNELITNALKHAFPGDRTGTVTVVAAPGPNDRLHLVVSDDGIGLPSGFDLAASTGLGMMIIDTLARQLDATLSIHPVGGTTFDLRIPLTALALTRSSAAVTHEQSQPDEG